MTVLGPLALYTSMALADDYSTRVALRRPGTVEMGRNGAGAKAVQAAALMIGDLVIQKKAPKLRWWYRAAAAVVVGRVVVGNLRVRGMAGAAGSRTGAGTAAR